MTVAEIWLSMECSRHISGSVTFNGTTAISGSSTNSFNHVTISGSLTAPLNGNINVAGNWLNNGSFTHNSGTVTFNSISTIQNVNGNSSNYIIIIFNNTGLKINENETVNNTLSFTNGKITTGSNTLILGASATTTGADSTQYIVGNEKIIYSSSSPNPRTFEIGDTTTTSRYAPVTLNFTSPLSSGNIFAKTIPVEHDSILTSGINSTRDINRFWTMTSSGLGLFSTD